METANSTYEIDDLNVRRLVGVNEPTHRQGVDGEWKAAVKIVTFPTGTGYAYLFVWDTAGKCTLTSDVISETN